MALQPLSKIPINLINSTHCGPSAEHLGAAMTQVPLLPGWRSALGHSTAAASLISVPRWGWCISCHQLPVDKNRLHPPREAPVVAAGEVASRRMVASSLGAEVGSALAAVVGQGWEVGAAWENRFLQLLVRLQPGPGAEPAGKGWPGAAALRGGSLVPVRGRGQRCLGGLGAGAGVLRSLRFLLGAG